MASSKIGESNCCRVQKCQNVRCKHRTSDIGIAAITQNNSLRPLSTRHLHNYAPHYHRCKRCGGFFPCLATDSRGCEQIIESSEKTDCGLGLRELQFENRHTGIISNRFEEAALYAE